MSPLDLSGPVADVPVTDLPVKFVTLFIPLFTQHLLSIARNLPYQLLYTLLFLMFTQCYYPNFTGMLARLLVARNRNLQTKVT